MTYRDCLKSLSLILSALFVFLICFDAFSKENEKILVGKTVNINTATVEQLAQVPLVSKDLAKAIVKYREENGDFRVIEEILQVEGFSRDLLRRIRKFLVLEGIGGDECSC